MGAHGPTLGGRLHRQLRQANRPSICKDLQCGLLLLCLGCMLNYEKGLSPSLGQATLLLCRQVPNPLRSVDAWPALPLGLIDIKDILMPSLILNRFSSPLAAAGRPRRRCSGPSTPPPRPGATATRTPASMRSAAPARRATWRIWPPRCGGSCPLSACLPAAHASQAARPAHSILRIGTDLNCLDHKFCA